MTKDSVSPERFLPLSALQFEILLSLSAQHMHGYGIIADVGSRTDGRVRLGTGALYTAIARLVTLTLIAETDRRDADDARRRYYKLTRIGRAVLEAEVARLDAMLLKAQAKGFRVRAVKGKP